MCDRPFHNIFTPKNNTVIRILYVCKGFLFSKDSFPSNENTEVNNTDNI